jgi:hypothetical protein
MPNQSDALTELMRRFVGAPVSIVFGLVLLVHIPAGLTCVLTGAVALLSGEHRGRHPAFGEVYF